MAQRWRYNQRVLWINNNESSLIIRREVVRSFPYFTSKAENLSLYNVVRAATCNTCASREIVKRGSARKKKREK